MKLWNCRCAQISQEHSRQVRSIRLLAEWKHTATGERKTIKTIILSLCLAASALSLNARAEDTLTRDALAENDRKYTDGPVTEVTYLQV